MMITCRSKKKLFSRTLSTTDASESKKDIFPEYFLAAFKLKLRKMENIEGNKLLTVLAEASSGLSQTLNMQSFTTIVNKSYHRRCLRGVLATPLTSYLLFLLLTFTFLSNYITFYGFHAFIIPERKISYLSITFNYSIPKVPPSLVEVGEIIRTSVP